VPGICERGPPLRQVLIILLFTGVEFMFRAVPARFSSVSRLTIFSRRFLLSLFLLFLMAGTAGCAAHHTTATSRQIAFAKKIHISGISDAGKINEFLYRGTQPKEAGVEQLRELGIDTIIDLRGENYDKMERERKHAESVGMRFVNIPGNGWSPPRDEQIAQFFSLVRERPRRRIFVHCWLGSDRSGVFLATYRMAFDGWTPEEALQEMRSFHFKGFWHPAMKAYIRDFPARLAHSPAMASFRQTGLTKKK
jgi:tyrosine-protein phosphatase SIW14